MKQASYKNIILIAVWPAHINYSGLHASRPFYLTASTCFVHAMATPHHPPHPVIFNPPSGPSSRTLVGGVQEDGRGSRKARDWAELPRDALLLVLEKLHHVDVLRGPELVCRTWHRAARDEPALWRHIDFRHQRVDDSTRWSLRLMAYAAVRRSRGRCEAFWGDGTVDERVMSLLEDS
jgi:hypothetical protein